MTYHPFQSLAYFTDQCIQFHRDNTDVPEAQTFYDHLADLIAEVQDQLMSLARLPDEIKMQLDNSGVYVPE